MNKVILLLLTIKISVLGFTEYTYYEQILQASVAQAKLTCGP